MLDRFFPPQTSRLDPETAAAGLRVITWTVMGTSLLILIAVSEMPDYTWRWLATIAAVYAVCIPVLILTKVGRTSAAGWLLAVGMGFITTLMALTAGGISAIAPITYLVPVLVVGLLFGGRAGAATALICLVASIGLAVFETAGWLPWQVLPYTPVLRWTAIAILIVIATAIQYVTSRATLEALQRSSEELQARKLTEGVLHESQETLRSSEKRFSVAFNANPALCTISSLDGRFVAVNSQFLQTTGYTREEVIGKTALDLEMWPNPKNRQVVMEKLKADGMVRGIAVDLRTKNGEDRVLLLSIERIELDGQPCLLHSGQDITERTRAEIAVKTSEEQLRALSARLRSAREEEGTRIAREIHDELGGALTGLKWDLQGIRESLMTSSNGGGNAAIAQKISNLADLVDTTISTVRRISSDLRPPVLDDLGLIAAVEWQAQQFQSRTGIRCECKTASDALDLDRDRATAVFRIFQEILTNVLRHSAATEILVEIRKELSNFVLEVTDNGRGISERDTAGASSLGLLGMRERAVLAGGDVLIRSTEGRGTNVVVRVPLAVP
ncbi:MAG TPA: PAS domain S-box protein [Terriglobia bacterium]|nr:PAS domain S-box protein [Terriglobia bacterium]